jgi:excisionase family DNA binding protein
MYEDEVVLTAEEVAKLLKVKVSTIFQYSSKKLFPCYKLNGKLLRFKKSEIMKWFNSQSANNLYQGDK